MGRFPSAALTRGSRWLEGGHVKRPPGSLPVDLGLTRRHSRTLAQPTVVSPQRPRVEASSRTSRRDGEGLVVEYQRELKRAASFPEHVLLHGARNRSMVEICIS